MARFSHHRCALQELSPFRWKLVQKLLSAPGRFSEPVQPGLANDRSVADFLAVVGFVGFVVFFLGLIWALDRV
jgi:hypothetical protein